MYIFTHTYIHINIFQYLSNNFNITFNIDFINTDVYGRAKSKGNP